MIALLNPFCGSKSQSTNTAPQLTTSDKRANSSAGKCKKLGDVPCYQELIPDEITTTHRPAETSETARKKAAYVLAELFAKGELVLGPDSME